MAPDAHRGLGQRILATDAGDVPLMEVRTIAITGSPEETTETPDTPGTTETTDTPDLTGDHG